MYTALMTFKIISLVDGSIKPCNLVNLSQSLSLNCEVLREVDGSHEAIGFVGHETLVFFAVEFADYALKNHSKEQIPAAEAAILLVRKWLQDKSSVSKEELKAADYAAAYAAADAAYAAYAAANAAHAAYAAANAANAAANAARAADAAAAHAAYDAAAHAAHAAHAAAEKSKLKEQERQGNFILGYFNTSVI